MLRPRCSLLFPPVIVGALAAALLLWVLNRPERYLQCASGMALVAFIGLVIALRRFGNANGLINIRNIVLSSYAIFLGLGMISDAFRQDWSFNGEVVVLAYGGLFCLLLGFALQPRKLLQESAHKTTFSLTSNQLFKLAMLFFTVGFSFLLLEWCLYGHLQSYSALSSVGSRAAVEPKPYINTFTQLTGPGLLLALILLRRSASLCRTCILASFSALTIAWYMFWGARINFAWVAVGILLVWHEIPDCHG
ncbi:MAG: hypothetical protein ACRD1J_13365, partial [Terriglobia bacterium]